MVRGGIRNNGGRGSIRQSGQNIRPAPFKKTFVPRHPFDLTLAELAFPRVGAVPDDSALTTVSTLFKFLSK